MNIPDFSSLPTLSQLGDKIPNDLKTISVTQRHVITISHAVAAHRVLETLPALPPSLALETLKIDGQTCAILQTRLVFNDDFHYTPLPLPNLEFWQLDCGVLVRRQLSDAAQNPVSSTRNAALSAALPSAPVTSYDRGIFVIQAFLGTRAAWVLQRAVASKADFANFNVVLRGSTTEPYSPLIADIFSSDAVSNASASGASVPENASSTEATPPTQIAVRNADQIVAIAPFVSAEKMSDFLLDRPTIFSKTSVGEKFVALRSQVKSASVPMRGETTAVGGEIKEARFGVWEKFGLLDAIAMRRPYSILLQAERKIVLQTPEIL